MPITKAEVEYYPSRYRRPRILDGIFNIVMPSFCILWHQLLQWKYYGDFLKEYVFGIHHCRMDKVYTNKILNVFDILCICFKLNKWRNNKKHEFFLEYFKILNFVWTCLLIETWSRAYTCDYWADFQILDFHDDGYHYRYGQQNLFSQQVYVVGTYLAGECIKYCRFNILHNIYVWKFI